MQDKYIQLAKNSGKQAMNRVLKKIRRKELVKTAFDCTVKGMIKTIIITGIILFCIIIFCCLAYVVVMLDNPVTNSLPIEDILQIIV